MILRSPTGNENGDVSLHRQCSFQGIPSFPHAFSGGSSRLSTDDFQTGTLIKTIGGDELGFVIPSLLPPIYKGVIHDLTPAPQRMKMETYPFTANAVFKEFRHSR